MWGLQAVYDTVTFSGGSSAPKQEEELTDDMPYTREMVESLQQLCREQEITIRSLTKEYEESLQKHLQAQSAPKSQAPPPASEQTDNDTQSFEDQSDLQVECAELRRINGSLREEHSSILVAQVKAQKKMSQMQARLQLLESAVAQHKSAEEYHKQCEAELQRLKGSDTKLTEVQRLCDAQRAEIEQLTESHTQQDKQLAMLRQELVAQQPSQTARENASAPAPTAAVATLHAELKQLHAKHDLRGRQVSTLEASMAALETERDRLRDESMELRRSASELKQRLAQAEAQGSATSGGEVALRQQFRADIQRILAKLKDTVEEKKRAEEKTAELATQLSAVTAEKRRVQEACDALRVQVAAPSKAQEDLDSQLSAVVIERDRAREEANQFKAQCAKLQQEQKQLTLAVSAKINNVKKKQAKKDAKIKSQHQKIKQLLAKVKALEGR